MKIRSGFVSNSSSSSFIVAFPREPKSARDVQRLMFGNETTIERYDNVVSTYKIAKTVWEDIRGQEPAYREALIELCERDVQLDYSKYEITNRDVEYLVVDNVTVLEAKHRRRYDWKQHGKDCKRIATREADKLMAKWEGGVIYIFHYGDDSGSYYATLEHGGIFNKLPHKQISNH